MKKPTSLLFALASSVVLLSHCATKPQPEAAAGPKTAATTSEATDELDDYAVVQVSDPLEPLNRATFKLNDGLYSYLFKPVSKTYETVTPRPVRRGLDNAFENIKFPVRFVNSALQGKFDRAGKEVGKFGLNTIAGVGGLFKKSDEIPALADVSAEDTAQTFAEWGLGQGPYVVLPLLGPSTVRDAVGLAGDYALNPANWGFAAQGSVRDLAWIPSLANNIRLMPDQFSRYDESKANAVDPYVSVRSVYYQNRKALEEQ